MRMLIPFLVGADVPQTEICRKVHHFCATLKQGQDCLSCCRMGEADKGQVCFLWCLGDHKCRVHCYPDAIIDRSYCAKLREHLIQALSNSATCRYRGNNELGMVRQ